MVDVNCDVLTLTMNEIKFFLKNMTKLRWNFLNGFFFRKMIGLPLHFVHTLYTCLCGRGIFRIFTSTPLSFLSSSSLFDRDLISLSLLSTASPAVAPPPPLPHHHRCPLPLLTHGRLIVLFLPIVLSPSPPSIFLPLSPRPFVTTTSILAFRFHSHQHRTPTSPQISPSP